MTPTMRERVARAIASVPPLAGQSAEDWMLARAEAAIKELREPSQAIIDSLNSNMTSKWPTPEIWGEAIDSALSEQP